MSDQRILYNEKINKYVVLTWDDATDTHTAYEDENGNVLKYDSIEEAEKDFKENIFPDYKKSMWSKSVGSVEVIVTEYYEPVKCIHS